MAPTRNSVQFSAAPAVRGPFHIYQPMFNFLYTAATTAAAPFVAAYLALTPRYRPLLRRFHPYVPLLPWSPLWVHACSVGEVMTARPLIERLRERFPQIPIVLTAATRTGHDQAEQIDAADHVLWFPIDQPWIVRHFITRLQPRALVLIETELWPALLRECARANVPIVLANGRLSDRHFPRYRRLRPFLRPHIARISAAGMQNLQYAERLELLGCPRQRITVTGNTKFEPPVTTHADQDRATQRAELGLKNDELVLLFGSTRPGDEALAAQCWRALHDAAPNLQLIIAPRHPDRRLADALEPFGGASPRRSEGAAFRDGNRILFLDTLGELRHFYAIADIAVVGGSFFPGVDGHNPLEPAAAGAATVFGPYMANFADAARTLVQTGAAVQVSDPAELSPLLMRLVADANARRDMAEKAAAAIAANRGALDATVALIASVLDATAANPIATQGHVARRQ